MKGLIKMKAVKTNNTNTIFKADKCFDLPATRYKYEDGSPGIETCWELSDEEIKEIVKNKRVFVYMLGETVPPMFVAAHSSISIEGGDGNEKR